MEGCIFCAISEGKIPSFTVYSDEKFIAFLDINPANQGHVVVIPKAHYKSIMEMDDATYARIFVVARAISLALLEYGAEGINFLLSMGESAGQRTPHLMLHVIPRYKNDSVHLVWEPAKIEQQKFEEIRSKVATLIKPPKPSEPAPQAPVQAQQSQLQQKPEPELIYKLPPRTGHYW